MVSPKKHNSLANDIYLKRIGMVIYMESLYAVFINGTMLYIKGNLSEQECIVVETIAKQFQRTNKDTVSCEAECQSFIKAVNASLHISLVQVPIKYVFRIK